MILAHVVPVKNTKSVVADKMVENQQIVTGFHAIEERIRKLEQLQKKGKTGSSTIVIKYSKAGPRAKKILEAAKACEIAVTQTTDADLDGMVKPLPETAQDHRGIILIESGAGKSESNFVEFDAFFAELCAAKENITVVVLDSITDPHNVGAIIRSCDQLGVDLVVLPENRSAKDSEVINRASAGATAWVPVTVVPNLVRCVEKMQKSGFWVYGADAGGTPAHEMDLSDKVVLVMGSEGSGISRLLSEKCDSIVSIPTCGKVDSLNVSVATGILLYEIRRQKLIK